MICLSVTSSHLDDNTSSILRRNREDSWRTKRKNQGKRYQGLRKKFDLHQILGISHSLAIWPFSRKKRLSLQSHKNQLLDQFGGFKQNHSNLFFYSTKDCEGIFRNASIEQTASISPSEWQSFDQSWKHEWHCGGELYKNARIFCYDQLGRLLKEHKTLKWVDISRNMSIQDNSKWFRGLSKEFLTKIIFISKFQLNNKWWHELIREDLDYKVVQITLLDYYSELVRVGLE